MILFDFDRLRRLRKRQGLTQNGAGKLLGYAGATVGRYERGDIQITVTELIRVANIYGDKNFKNFFVERVGD